MNTEQMIQEKGATKAPRITPAHIDDTIAACYFFTGEDGIVGADLLTSSKQTTEIHQSVKLLTICVLVLKNGFTVTGESACASPENFNADIGREIAHKNAKEKIWLLEGYLLKQNLHEQKLNQEMLASFSEGDCDGCKL